MTWSYDPTRIATSLKDRIRFELQDVDPNEPLLQDEEIAAGLAIFGVLPSGAGLVRCLAWCAEAIYRSMARNALSGVDTVSFTTRAQHWQTVWADLRARAIKTAAPRMNSGFTANPQPDAGAPNFAIGQMDDTGPQAVDIDRLARDGLF